MAAFTLCRFLRNATNQTVLAQFPTPSATIRFKYPREGTPRAPKRRGRRVSKSRGMSHNSAHLLCTWKNTNINKVQNWASHGLSPTSPKPPSPTRRSGNRILRGYCGAREFVVPAHFIIGPKIKTKENDFRGREVKIQKRPRYMAEDDLMLGTSQNA